MSGQVAPTGRFWSGAGVGLGTGLAGAIALGWWLSTTPAAAPAPTSQGPGTQQDAAPPAREVAPAPPPPAFSPSEARLADTADPATAADHSPGSTPASPRRAVESVPAPVPESPAPTPPDEAERGPPPAPSPAPLPPSTAPGPPTAPEAEARVATAEVLPLRERFDSLSDALLTAPQESTEAPSLAAPVAAEESAGPQAALQDPWIDVWQPFRSPVSAQGFADRLELLTGFNYRVERRSGDGLHQVAVQPIAGYAPEQMLVQIAERSGLAVGAAP